MDVKNILLDTDDAFLDIHDNIMWLDNMQSYTWTSEKDGWMHLYKVSRDGQQMELITKGEFDVVSISCIDPKGGYVYYIASPDNATERYLYRSRIDRKGVLVGNEVTWARYASLGLNPKEFFRVDIGDAELDGWMIKPIDFGVADSPPLPVQRNSDGKHRPTELAASKTWSTGMTGLNPDSAIVDAPSAFKSAIQIKMSGSRGDYFLSLPNTANNIERARINFTLR